jgi:hypothetical protein
MVLSIGFDSVFAVLVPDLGLLELLESFTCLCHKTTPIPATQHLKCVL